MRRGSLGVADSSLDRLFLSLNLLTRSSLVVVVTAGSLLFVNQLRVCQTLRAQRALRLTAIGIRGRGFGEETTATALNVVWRFGPCFFPFLPLFTAF